MTNLTDILRQDFLIFLQNYLTRLLEGKMSVVFEDAQCRPISGYEQERVFARENVCKNMIDCEDNPYGKEKCWESDKLGGLMAKDKGKGVLYRCHKGLGFPNFLFPIKIWRQDVVGYLYAGQFVFRKMTKKESADLLRKLQKRYYIPSKKDFRRYAHVTYWNPSDFIEELDEFKAARFYETVIPSQLTRTHPREFSLKRFQKLVQKQNDEFGLDPKMFFFVIKSLEQLANELSRIGNALYTLKSLVRLDRNLPRILKFRRASTLEDLESFIYSVVVEESQDKSIEAKTIEDIADKTLSLLSDLKNYEDRYLRQLVRPFELYDLPASDYLRRLVLEFYLRYSAYEVERYSLSRAELQNKGSMKEFLKDGDKVVLDFAELACEIGKEYPTLQEFCLKTLAGIYRNMYWIFLKEDLSQYAYQMIGNIAVTEKMLSEIGIEIQPEQYLKNPGVVETRVAFTSHPFETMVEDLGQVGRELRGTMSKIEKKHTIQKNSGLISAYLEDLEPIKQSILENVLVSPEKEWASAQRKQLDLKGYRIFLNSGGLTPTHLAVSRAQGSWILERNEEGPIGIDLENELLTKIETARERVAAFVGAESPDCVFFNYNTTLSIDFALRSINLKKGENILITDLEHDTVKCLTEYWRDMHGTRCTSAPISADQENPDLWPSIMARYLTRSTRIIIFSHITFGTSTVFPVVQTIKECRKRFEELGGNPENLFILIDGAQAVGNIDVRVKDIDCDFYAFDGHKWLMGPEGSGALYVKKKHFEKKDNERLKFPIFVAHMASEKVVSLHNKSELELGTIDAAKVIGFGEAVRVFQEIGFDKIRERKKDLTLRFINKVRENPLFEIVNSHNAHETGMVNIQISKWKQSIELYELLTKLLQDRNIVIRYIKNPPSLRFCFHFYNSETEIDIAVKALESLVEGAKVNRVNQQQVVEELEKRVRRSFSSKSKTRKVGVILFGPPATGKDTVVKKLIERLKKDRVSLIEISASNVESRPEFRRELKQARNKQPAIVFFNEAEGFFAKGQSFVRDLNPVLDEVKEDLDRVFFIAAVNKIQQIDESVRKRRLLPMYLPLPDRKTRLAFIKEQFSRKPCSGHLTLRELAEMTDGFSFKDLQDLCTKIDELAGPNPVDKHIINKAFKDSIPSTTAEEIKEYKEWAEKRGAITFTGLEELKKYTQ